MRSSLFRYGDDNNDDDSVWLFATSSKFKFVLHELQIMSQLLFFKFNKASNRRFIICTKPLNKRMKTTAPTGAVPPLPTTSFCFLQESKGAN